MPRVAEPPSQELTMPLTSKVTVPSVGQAAAPYDVVEVPEPRVVTAGWADHFRPASVQAPVTREARMAVPAQEPVTKFDSDSSAEVTTAPAGTSARAE